MYPPLHFALEAHPSAATLLIEGTIAPAEAVRALRACYHLPARVRHLRLDLRRAHVPDVHAADALDFLIDRWRTARGGSVRVVMPWPGPGVVPPTAGWMRGSPLPVR